MMMISYCDEGCSAASNNTAAGTPAPWVMHEGSDEEVGPRPSRELTSYEKGGVFLPSLATSHSKQHFRAESNAGFPRHYTCNNRMRVRRRRQQQQQQQQQQQYRR